MTIRSASLRPGRSQRAPVLLQWIRSQPVAAIGTAFLLCLLVTAGLAAQVAPYDPRAQDLPRRLEGASAQHPLGTDHYGRDILSRLIWGTRVSLAVALFGVGSSMFAGVAVGTFVGYRGGAVDELAMRGTDLLMSFPALLLGLVVVSALGPGLPNVIVAISLALLPRFIRLVRGLTMTLRSREFIVAARALGATDGRIITRHVAPQIFGQIVVIGTLWTATAIRVEASLSFLGLGISPPTPTLGNMIGDAVNYLTVRPSFAVYSSLALGLTVLAFNLIGDAFQETLDPRLRSLRVGRQGTSPKRPSGRSER